MKRTIRFLTIAFLAGLLVGERISSADGPRRLIIPAYGNPCCGTGQRLWEALINHSRPGVMDVILNPNSGPGASPIDPNYIRPDGTGGPLLELAQTGATVLGYVHTQWARRDLASVMSEIDRYFDAAYYRHAGFQLSGIFVDEMSNDLQNLDYYRSIAQHVRAKGDGSIVVGNPGTPSIVDTSQGTSGNTPAQYGGVLDRLVVFEGNPITYRNQFATPEWIDSLPASRFAHIVHSETSLENMEVDLRLAEDRNVGTMYITDDILPNPYDQLPTFWNQLFQSVVPPVSIDELSSAIRAGWRGRSLDLNRDGNVDDQDRVFWVREIAETTFGDSNLDGRFDSSDLSLVFAAGQYNDDQPLNSIWATGDWNGDGEFSSSDLILAMQWGGYERATRQVPEPKLPLIVWLSAAFWCRTNVTPGRRPRRLPDDTSVM